MMGFQEQVLSAETLKKSALFQKCVFYRISGVIIKPAEPQPRHSNSLRERASQKSPLPPFSKGGLGGFQRRVDKSRYLPKFQDFYTLTVHKESSSNFGTRPKNLLRRFHDERRCGRFSLSDSDWGIWGLAPGPERRGHCQRGNERGGQAGGN
jgi:hypothetical protein